MGKSLYSRKFDVGVNAPLRGGCHARGKQVQGGIWGGVKPLKRLNGQDLGCMLQLKCLACLQSLHSQRTWGDIDLVPPGLEISSSNAPTSLDHQDPMEKEKILMVPLRTSQGWVWPPTGWRGRVLHGWGQCGGTPGGHLHRGHRVVPGSFLPSGFQRVSHQRPRKDRETQQT